MTGNCGRSSLVATSDSCVHDKLCRVTKVDLSSQIELFKGGSQARIRTYLVDPAFDVQRCNFSTPTLQISSSMFLKMARLSFGEDGCNANAGWGGSRTGRSDMTWLVYHDPGSTPPLCLSL